MILTQVQPFFRLRPQNVQGQRQEHKELKKKIDGLLSNGSFCNEPGLKTNLSNFSFISFH